MSADDRGSAPASPRRPAQPHLVRAVCAGVAALWVLMDQATKVLAVETLQGRGVVDAGLGGLLEWELIRNTNAAFGIPGFSGMFLLIGVVVVATVLRVLPHTDRLLLALAYGMVTGGALGNLVDRLFRVPGFPDGGVVDFIRLGWWPKFNIADVGITVGAALILLLTFLADREGAREETSGGAGAATDHDAAARRR